MSTCPWCPQPEGHTGVCGDVGAVRPPPSCPSGPSMLVDVGNASYRHVVLLPDNAVAVYETYRGRWVRMHPHAEQRTSLDVAEFSSAVDLVTGSVRLSGRRVTGYRRADVYARYGSPVEHDWDAGDEANHRDTEGEDPRAQRAEERELKAE